MKKMIDNKIKNMNRRMNIIIQGAVQGVGFRPFVFRLAESMGLKGWVINSAQGVVIDIEGNADLLNTFLLCLEKEKPALSFIQSLESAFLDPKGFTSFEVRTSDAKGSKTALILPDIRTCPDCLAEIFDPHNRRYLYPFTNCTNCGPRFSIITGLPYDRPHTTMADFVMCDHCRAEYTDPRNRRFHAQPNACPDCGPQVQFWDSNGTHLTSMHQAISDAAEAIQDGRIVAVKGIGGFHLMADAGNEDAVRRLRRKKQREHKPLAMMFPSLEAIETRCHANALEKRLLTSPEAPIVLLRARKDGRNGAQTTTVSIAASVAPQNPYFGVMLPYTPLHHILMAKLNFPVIATSGNISEEPICIDENEAVDRLGRTGICDFFLVHNRPIARHVDDSIVCVRMGRQQVMRRARGFAPLPVNIQFPVNNCIAVGAHLKNTVALARSSNVFVSQHIGDLESPKAFDAFKKVIADFQTLYDAPAKTIAADLHPGYLSSQFAKSTDLPVINIQHHFAHILSCMADNHLHPPVLGIAWDGTGYGPDGTIWGGEFLKINAHGFDRAAHWRTFSLPGGEKAIREPRRCAVGLLYEIFGNDLFSNPSLTAVRSFSDPERGMLKAMIKKRLNSPVTSSLGRIFDAVAAILDVARYSQFEGQAAMALEFLAETVKTGKTYPLKFSAAPVDFSAAPASDHNTSPQPIIVDWEPMIRGILDDISRQMPVAIISAIFHNTLSEAAVQIARKTGEKRVVLSGGCFQNRYLTEKTVARLTDAGFAVYWHQRVPPNDGGISLGQAMGAALLNS